MDDAFSVCCFKPIGDVDRDSEEALQLNGPLLNDMF
jgi:hypothetical protein